MIIMKIVIILVTLTVMWNFDTVTSLCVMHILDLSQKCSINKIVGGDTFRMYYQRLWSEQNCKNDIQTETKLLV